MLIAACLALAAAAAQGQQPAQAPVVPPVREIAPGVSLVMGQFTRGQQPDGNSIVLHGRDGTIIIDTGRHVQHTQRVIAAATTSGAKPVAVINTHWHLDHIGGNALIRQRYPGVVVLASGALADARKGFLAGYREELAKMVASTPAVKSGGFREEMALIDAADKLAPTEVLTSGANRTIAGRLLTLGLEKNAATEGDVWVLDRASGTLMTGDLVTLPVPFLDTANPEGWAQALDRLAKIDAKLVVPGHGEPMPPSGLQTYRKAFHDLLACSKSKRASAECSDGWFAAIGDLGRGTDPSLAKSAMGYYLDNVLRQPKAAPSK
jgi:glyoxylase-like metal-dependent hydrolase (beta-lactamase superfamily II)